MIKMKHQTLFVKHFKTPQRTTVLHRVNNMLYKIHVKPGNKNGKTHKFRSNYKIRQKSTLHKELKTNKKTGVLRLKTR